MKGLLGVQELATRKGGGARHAGVLSGLSDNTLQGQRSVADLRRARRHTLAHTLRLVVSAHSCQSAAKPCYRALTGEEGTVERE